ncbi:MAG: TIGR03936 family radical SAM-associated protein [Coriobacteriales bacterium]
MSEGFRLRVKYQITGRLAYLSHLETVRSMERIVRRARLPFAITEGFNPHMKIAFGPALPVGAGSRGEYFDVRLSEYVDPAIALEALQGSAPENLMPIACAYCAHDADSIDVTYPVSVWCAVLDAGDVPVGDIERAFSQLVETGFIEVVKTKGRATKVKRVEFEGRLIDGPHVAGNGDGVTVEFTTFQGSDGALRPDKFISAALEGANADISLMSLTRMELREA